MQVWVPQHLKLEAPTCLQVLATSGLSHEHQTASFSLPPPSILLFFMLGLSSFNELISQLTGSIPNYNRTQFRQPSELSAEITLFMGRGCVQRGHTTSQAQSCKLPKGLRCVPPTKSPANQGDGGEGYRDTLAAQSRHRLAALLPSMFALPLKGPWGQLVWSAGRGSHPSSILGKGLNLDPKGEGWEGRAEVGVSSGG